MISKLVCSALLVLTPFWVFAACKAETSDGKDYFVVTVTGFNPPPFSPGDYSIGGIIYEATAAGLMFTNKRSDKPQTECDTPTNIFVTGIGSPGGNNVYPTSVRISGFGSLIVQANPFPMMMVAHGVQCHGRKATPPEYS